MPHLPNPSGLPGISGLFAFRPETGVPMRALAQALLRGPSPLTPGERELIASHVSSRNECRFCTRSHAAVTRRLGEAHVDAVVAGNLEGLGDRMRALLAIAEHVRARVAPLPDALVDAAKRAGADDVAIHDAALIAAAFSMFNRYVEALGAETPEEGAPSYEAGAERLVTQGYVGQGVPKQT